MGLSRRRRAKATTHRQPTEWSAASAKASGAVGLPQASRRHSGKTQRNVSRKVAQEMKRCLLSFDVKPSPESGDHRGSKDSRGRIAANPNLNGSDRIRLQDSYYNSRVAYSLNKKSLWAIEDQIAVEYNSGDSDLREDNLFVFSAEWRPQGRGGLVTRRLATNAAHMRLAAGELRQQQRRKSGQTKADDELAFSDSVQQLQNERPLVRAAGCRNRINRDSLRQSFEMPECQQHFDAQALKSDFERRTTVCIDIRRPEACIGNRVSHSRLVEQKHYRRRHQQRQRWSTRNENLQQDYMYENEKYFDDELDSDDDMEMHFQPQPVATLFDFMCLPTASEELQNYFEAELHEVSDVRQKIPTKPSKYAEDNVLLCKEKNPVCQVDSHLIAPERLEQLFNGTNALCMSDSRPRKFSVLLQDNLAELVSFEVVSEGADDFTATIEVRHSLIATDTGAKSFQRTSSAEVAASSDPCAFLRSLLNQGATLACGSMQRHPLESPLPAGWCHTEVWQEADARLAALRSLPMFAASWNATSVNLSAGQSVITGLECEICCSPMRLDVAVDTSERSTELGACGHRFCNACWVRHVTSCLKAGGTRVECPANGCAAVLDAAVLLCFCPQRLLPALVGAAFRAWQRSLPTSRFCPLPRCGRLLVAADDSGKNALCSCWTSVCLACGQEPHWPVDCATTDRYISELAIKGHGNLRSRELFAVTSVRGKRCPGCQILVEKGEGCSHMSCACGHEFCWDCLGTYSQDHSCNDQRASFIYKKFFAEDDLLAPTSERSLMYCTAIRTRRARHDGPRLLESQARLAARLLSVAGRSVANSDQIVADALVSSYLLEYTCVLLDANEADDQWQSMVHNVGETIQQVLRSVHAELQLEGRGFGDMSEPGKATQLCDRLEGLQRQLAAGCLRLREVLAEFGGQFRAH